jgi:hypothetical protein
VQHPTGQKQKQENFAATNLSRPELKICNLEELTFLSYDARLLVSDAFMSWQWFACLYINTIILSLDNLILAANVTA